MLPTFRRYRLRQTSVGWEVFDIWTGLAIRICGKWQIGLSEPAARALADRENTRASNGVRSVLL